MSSILTSLEKEVRMEGHWVMSAKERRRKVEFEWVRKGRLTIKEAAVRLELSYRHCRRSYKRFREEGDVGLVHRRRGRPSHSEIDSHRPAPTERELRRIFCIEKIRVVANDWTARCENRLYQILKRNDPLLLLCMLTQTKTKEDISIGS